MFPTGLDKGAAVPLHVSVCIPPPNPATVKGTARAEVTADEREPPASSSDRRFFLFKIKARNLQTFFKNDKILILSRYNEKRVLLLGHKGLVIATRRSLL